MEKTIYAIQLLKENENPPAEISFAGIDVPAKSVIQLVGSNKKLKWKKDGETTHVFLPGNGKSQHAVAVKIIVPAK
ncbi:MAG: hypothetical protein WDO19_09190 [Bacteroidota bacterium]